MNEPKWKLIKNIITKNEDVVLRTWDDGHQESCMITAKEYLEWLAEGNTPEPADEPN